MTDTMLSSPKKAERFFADKLDFILDPVKVNQQIKNGGNLVVIDVRDAKDFIKGHVPGAINLPKGQWEDFSGCPSDRSLVVYCYSPTCHLADHAALEFARRGHSVLEMEGGFETWKKNRLPLEV